MTSPAAMSSPSIISLFSTIPTANPARSYSPSPPPGDAGGALPPPRSLPGLRGAPPADERAARELAAPGDALDDFGGDRDVELAAGEIVEKEERFRALREDVVDAHRHEVDADRVVHPELERELQLGSDAVGARHQHRFAKFPGDLEKR